MKRLFDILPADFFKPLTSKYRQEYADCIMRLFNAFKPEISYGVGREIVVKELADYFEADDVEMSFDGSESSDQCGVMRICHSRYREHEPCDQG